MTGLFETPGESPMTAVEKWRRREERRKRYLRRRIVAGLLLLTVLAALYFALNALLTSLVGEKESKPPVAEEPTTVADTLALSFTPERYIAVSDLDGDGLPERIAVSAAESFLVTVALVTGTEKSPKQIGSATQIAAFPLEVVDLPRAKRVLISKGALPMEGEPRQVLVGGEPAVEAAGEEPDFQAWTLDPQRGLIPADYYQLAAPATPPEPTMILVDKWLNVLWYYEDGKLVQTSRVGTGRQIEGPAPSAANHMQNTITPEGKFTIGNKQENPPYYRENILGGDPRNPLGSRFMGFSVYANDRAMLWAIHGTNDAENRIGRWVTNGPIEMAKDDLEKLYERVKIGTVLQVVGESK